MGRVTSWKNACTMVETVIQKSPLSPPRAVRRSERKKEVFAERGQACAGKANTRQSGSGPAAVFWREAGETAAYALLGLAAGLGIGAVVGVFGGAILPQAAVVCIVAYLFNFGHSVYNQRVREDIVWHVVRRIGVQREELPLRGKPGAFPVLP